MRQDCGTQKLSSYLLVSNCYLTLTKTLTQMKKLWMVSEVTPKVIKGMLKD